MTSQDWRQAVFPQHQHNSDDDDEESHSPRSNFFHSTRRRSRSFSEAEDSVSGGSSRLLIEPRRLLADHGGGSGKYQYPSTGESGGTGSGGGSSYWSPERSGLHHRHPVQVLHSDDDDDEFHDEKKETGSFARRQRRYRGQNNSDSSKSPTHKQRRISQKKKLQCTRLVWRGVFCAVVAYVCFVCVVYQQMPDDRQGPFHFQQLFSTDDAQTRLARQVTDELEAIAYREVQAKTRWLASSRRERTRPSISGLSGGTIPAFKILAVDQEERDSYAYPGEEEFPGMKPAALEELCGFHAQNASLAYPNSYLERDALNSNSSVLITGILNPIGFHLALALKERCGVQVMTGIDSMFPVTVKNRLAILEQIQILTTNIPQLRRPILTPFVGLDPKVSKKSVFLDVTGELDLGTFAPTHIVHLSSYAPQVYRNPHGERKNLQSPYVSEDYDPLLFPIRSTLASMEQILASVTTADPATRPHLTYASANRQWQESTQRDDVLHCHTRKMDEMLADAYHSSYGAYSVAMRLPNAVYGSWSHPDSSLHRVLQGVARNKTVPTTSFAGSLDMVHVDDIVDSFITAMQFRAPDSKPTAFELTSGTSVSLESVHDAAKTLLSQSNDTVSVAATETSMDDITRQTKQYLEWTPHTPIESGLLRLMAWFLDRKNPYGIQPTNSSTIETGDALLTRHEHDTCAADDVVCHSSRRYLPCVSECASRSQCTPSIFDDMVEMAHEVTEGCDVILYTQAFGNDVEDLELQSEYMDEGDPLICNFAFVSSTSKLVETVIHKVPNSELANLGVAPRPEDLGKVGAIQERKLEKLNGRLLYRGWVLIWVKDTPEVLPKTDEFLLKLSPGRLFSKDTAYAVFIDPGFAVSPTADDVKFLIHEMHRPAWDQRTVKRKAKPKARFRLPAEPERSAMMLMSQLKFQYSKETERLPDDTKLSVYQATKFMRYENGEKTLGKETPDIKLQREFYERVSSVVNRDPLRSPLEPMYQYSIKHWARSRWVVHDMTRVEAQELRCEWYQEHIQWDAGLDQLSFAHVMAKRELERRMTFEEPDDHARKAFAEKTEMKKLLTDAHEWQPMQTEQNKYFCFHDELEMLPYDSVDAKKDTTSLGLEPPPNKRASLFVRIISDRIMSFARKAWNEVKAEDEEEEDESTEL